MHHYIIIMMLLFFTQPKSNSFHWWCFQWGHQKHCFQIHQTLLTLFLNCSSVASDTALPTSLTNSPAPGTAPIMLSQLPRESPLRLTAQSPVQSLDMHPVGLQGLGPQLSFFFSSMFSFIYFMHPTPVSLSTHSPMTQNSVSQLRYSSQTPD